ncbi:MAG: RluA family pseudouridine synthase [Bdellovibrionales bacterium]|nr:RluA family pseudouridine synthase [Bdellovibrionales bacterium]
MTEKIITIKTSVREGDPLVLIDFLEKHTKLSKSVLKKVLNNGGVWVRKIATSKRLKTRRATAPLNLDSHIEFFYDPKFLSMEVPESREVLPNKEWGLWYKPPGLLSQGTDFGDHCSILRQVEKTKGKAFLIHRLDREAHGLMLFAYTHHAAGSFSKLWQDGKVEKFYKVEVVGDLQKKFPEGGEISFKIDGKDARTTFKILEQKEFTAILLVQIHTGRLHQIRRHFEELGYPVLGDPKYGTTNKNNDGIRLMAYQLKFTDPLSKRPVNFELSDVVF